MQIGSELNQAITAEHGNEIRRIGIVKKLPVITTDRSIRRLLGQYIDETMKPGSRGTTSGPQGSAYVERLMGGEVPQRAGIDYVAGGRPGLHLFGFVRGAVEERCGALDKLSSNEIAVNLRRWWLRSLRRSAKKGHHFIFSVDPRLATRFAGRNVPVDDVLLASVAEAFVAYNNRFLPGSSVGWAVGIHHDRFHVHAHALLYPASSTGKSLNVSRNAPATVGGRAIRVNYQQTITTAYSSALERFVAMARMPAVTDLRHCRAGIAEVFGQLDLSREAIVSKGTRAAMSGIVSGWSDTMETPNLLAALRGHADKLRGVEATQELTSEASDVVEQDLGTLLKEHESGVNRMRKFREQIAGQFTQWRSSPDQYAMIQYAPGLPPQSPSNTLTHLGYRLDRWPRPAPSRADVDRRINAMLERLDGLLSAHDAALPNEPLVSAAAIDEQFRRCLRAVFRGSALLNFLWRRRGEPTLASDLRSLSSVTAKSLQTAADDVRGMIVESALDIARVHHTATTHELIRSFERHMLRRLAGEPEAEEEIAELDLPTSTPMIPATANFLEREAAVGAKIRGMEEMRQEERETHERLSRVIATLPYTPYVFRE